MSFYVFLPAKNASLREQVKTLRASDSLRQEEILANSLTEFDEEEFIRDIHQEGYDEGFSNGIRQNAVEAARNALKMNLTIEQVSQITSLSQEEVRELARDVNS